MDGVVPFAHVDWGLPPKLTASPRRREYSIQNLRMANSNPLSFDSNIRTKSTKIQKHSAVRQCHSYLTPFSSLRVARPLPDRLGRYRVHLRYGLFFRRWLLPTLSVENPISLGYGEVTNTPIGTCNRLFNRLHRRTSHARQSVGPTSRST